MRVVLLLLALVQAAALRAPLSASKSRRAVVGRTAALLPLALSSAASALPAIPSIPASVEFRGQEVDISFAGEDSMSDFRAEKKKQLEEQKKAAEKAAAQAEAVGAKAAKELEAQAKKVSDKKPLTFAQMLENSVKQREAETGMTMSEDEIATLEAKLRKAFPGVA